MSTSPTDALSSPLQPAPRTRTGRLTGDRRGGASARRLTSLSSPAIGWREILLVSLAGVALAVLTTWPLVLHMPSRIAPDLGDPVRTAWQIAWVGHAMLHSPLHLFDANAFYPHPLSLAFSDSLLGYGPSAFFGSGTVAALVRYNLLFLFAWSLCFIGAYLLARELGVGKLGGAAAGAAFAYAPYRVTEAGHLHVISSGGNTARAVLAPARLPARLPAAGDRRLARVGVADQPRLHAGAAVRLPAAGARAGGRSRTG